MPNNPDAISQNDSQHIVVRLHNQEFTCCKNQRPPSPRRTKLALLPENNFSRRGFIVISLGAGFAASMLPVSAQTITTPADRLVAGEIDVPTKDGDMVAYGAMPATETGFPVVLVVQEIFGAHKHIKDVCRHSPSSATSRFPPNCSRDRATCQK